MHLQQLSTAMSKIRTVGTTAVLAGSLALTLSCTASAQSYKVENTWKIGGDGGWDYLVANPDTHRLYVTHGTRVEVLDLATGKPVGAVTGFKGTHGVVFDGTGKFGYISDGRSNAVAVFDLASLQVVATIPAGTNPDGMVYEPVTKTVWAFNGNSKDATVIDTASRKVVATVPLSGKPEFPVADGTGNVYVNIETKNTIVHLDAKSHKVIAEWSIAPCESPSGLAIDLAGKRLFSVCDGNKMAVVDYTTGKLLATPAIGDGPDAAGYDAEAKLAFASSGDGKLSVVDASNKSYKTVQTLTTAKGARTMTLDPSTGKIYVVTAKFGPAPAATDANPHPRPAIVPNSFSVMVIGK